MQKLYCSCHSCVGIRSYYCLIEINDALEIKNFKALESSKDKNYVLACFLSEHFDLIDLLDHNLRAAGAYFDMFKAIINLNG